MTRCKVCGKEVESGKYCSADCERKWTEIKRDLEGDLEDNPFESGEVESVESPEPPLTRGLEEEEQVVELTAALMVESEKEETVSVEANDLISAVSANDLKSVMSFLAQGSDINMQNDRGLTALHEAAKEGNVEIAKLLIEKGAKINFVNPKGWTALHRAVNYGKIEIVKLLLNKNADFNLKTFDDMTPLSLAFKNNHPEIARFLLENGADSNCCIDNKGLTPLFSALRKGDVDLAKLIINNGASPDTMDGKESALFFAIKNGFAEIAIQLIEKGANPDTAEDNEPVLNLALKKGMVEIAKLLILKGADVKKRGRGKSTPLHLATEMNNLELVKMIVAKKVNLVLPDKLGYYPLHKTTDKDIASFLKRKMFPDKILYSLRIFGLILLLTSIALPFFISFIFAGLTFLAALIFTDWPSRESYRVYLLEILAVYLVITSAMGVHPNSFDYPFVFLIIPVGVFFLFNFILRPTALFIPAVNDDGTKPKFPSFYKEHIGSQLSFSPITILRSLNVIAILAIFLMYGFFNYDHLKKNEEYILSHAVKLIPEKQRAAFVYEETQETKKIVLPENIEYKQNFSGQKDLDRAISQYLSKNFKGAAESLNTAMQDITITQKANEIRLEINRFSRLWDRVRKPGSENDKRRGAMIDRMIKYDKNISGGLLEAEILMMKHAE